VNGSRLKAAKVSALDATLSHEQRKLVAELKADYQALGACLKESKRTGNGVAARAARRQRTASSAMIAMLSRSSAAHRARSRVNAARKMMKGYI
jgi:phage terminase large subunit GpA-like protein